MFLEISQNSQEHTWGLQLYLKRDSGQVFSREFCESSKNTFFTEHLWETASGHIASLEDLEAVAP